MIFTANDNEVKTCDLKSRGWTEYAVRKFLSPSRTAHGSYHNTHFYSKADVEMAMTSEAYLSWQTKRGRNAEIKNERKVCALRQEAQRKLALAQSLSSRYGIWQAALPDACNYLFELNRFAKHEDCFRRDIIYDLKNKLVNILYAHGYSTECYLHKTELPAKVCFACDGTGGYRYSDVGDDEKCYKCDGTGIYLPKKTLTFVCFRFLVGHRRYCWHQPKHLVKFAYTTTTEESQFELSEEPKPTTLTREEMTRGIQVIQWVIDNAHQIQSEVAA